MTTTNPVVVIIEDDPQMRRFLCTGLSTQGLQVFEAETGARGLVEAGTRKPDLIILDLGLPDIDGVDVILALRKWTAIPVIILSARSAEEQKIEALDAGADDYLTKPFGIGELLARVRVALRRWAGGANGTQNPIYIRGRLKVDLQNRTVSIYDEEIRLTPIQYRLLSVLVKNAGKVMTQRQLMRDVWGPAYADNAHYLRIYVSQLRHKLEADPAKPEILLTESGIGYRLKA